MFSELASGNAPNPICPQGGAAHNMTWFSFIVGIPNFSFKIIPNNCTIVTWFEGIQVAVYADCDYTEVVFCEPNCSAELLLVTAGNLDWK